MRVFFAVVSAFAIFSPPTIVRAENIVVSAKNDHQDDIIQDLVKNFEALSADSRRLSASFEALSADNRRLSSISEAIAADNQRLSGKVAKLEPSTTTPATAIEKGKSVTTASTRGAVTLSRYLSENQTEVNATETAILEGSITTLATILNDALAKKEGPGGPNAGATSSSFGYCPICQFKDILIVLLGIDDIENDIEDIEGRLDTLEVSLAGAHGIISDLEDDIDDINAQLATINKCVAFTSSPNTCLFGEHAATLSIAKIEMKTTLGKVGIDTSGKLNALLQGGYELKHVDSYTAAMPNLISIINH